MTALSIIVASFLWLAIFLLEFPSGSAFQNALLQRTTKTPTAISSSFVGSEPEEGDGRPNIVQRCFDAFNNRDIASLMDCFEDDCRYEDTLFQGEPASNKGSLQSRFQRAMDTTPRNVRVVVDQMASDPKTGKLGARWHLQVQNRALPFSNGCSFYTTNLDTGRIQTGFRVMETPFKPDDAIFNLLIGPTKLLESVLPNSGKEGTASSPEGDDATKTILEQAYDRWNRRDMDATVECFSKDILLEDTLYWKPIRGRENLRKHYQRVSEQVPGACRIMLDDVVKDPANGNIAARWHLEMSDTQLLEGFGRGCSMYTTDTDTGLMTSGMDVTEGPLKVDENALSLALSPLQMLRKRLA